MTNLFITCILQNIVNIVIKLIIYYFDEIFMAFSFLIIFSINGVLNMLFFDDESKFNKNISLLLLNTFLIFNLLIFIEVIIIKIFNLEKKTKKYLEKEQEREKNMMINMTNNSMNSYNNESILDPF